MGKIEREKKRHRPMPAALSLTPITRVQDTEDRTTVLPVIKKARSN
jgi:hypothetical protein